MAPTFAMPTTAVAKQLLDLMPQLRDRARGIAKRGMKAMGEWVDSRDDVSWVSPYAGIICFPRFKGVTDTVALAKRALDEHLSYFSAAARTDTDDFTIGIITDLLDPENPGGGLLSSRVRPGIINGEAEDMIFDPVDMMLSELESHRDGTVLSEVPRSEQKTQARAD